MDADAMAVDREESKGSQDVQSPGRDEQVVEEKTSATEADTTTVVNDKIETLPAAMETDDGAANDGNNVKEVGEPAQDAGAVVESKVSPGEDAKPPATESTPGATEPPQPTQDAHLAGLESSAALAVDNAETASVTSSAHTTDRTLNVTDALTYLDDVKSTFKHQPDVYNHFLDIMKEFKNNLIDTPGVIKRVSCLFNGHPSLIQGFNTFLPVGYRIECTSTGEESNFITVTMPTGSMMRTTNNGPNSTPILWHDVDPNAPDVLPPQLSTSTLKGRSLGIDAGLPARGAAGTPDPASFVREGEAIAPAVQYVNKIKQSCDPSTYKQFLDILAKYHKRADSMDEEEVSRQIAILFKDAPELREEFRIFLPDRYHQSFVNGIPIDGRAINENGIPSESKGKRRADPTTEPSPQKRRRKATDKERTKEREREQRERDRDRERRREPDSSRVYQNKVKRSKHRSAQDAVVPSAAYNGQGPLPSNIPVPGLPYPHMNGTSKSQQVHVRFFDRVRRAIDNQETYNEFLKSVNLFTQGFIDTGRLAKESRNFLGDGELWKQFADILGWDERKEREMRYLEQNQHHEWTKPTIAAIQEQRSTGPRFTATQGSYRRLPSNEAAVPCSGRDGMCRQVLNDEWVSHPTWSSDEPVFRPTPKNPYEEALHRSEEERHEYDFYIEGITRTISALEPLNNKLVQMTTEERVGFKLKPNLHGVGKAVHQRVIKKIYGADGGMDVIVAMQEQPGLAVPVVLQRLKSKEEEWKRAQREWNKVWREVDVKNYAKSLDYQGVVFKAADRKALTTRSFVNQIETLKAEQTSRRAQFVDASFKRTISRHQLEFVLDDIGVLQDALKLTLSFLDRAHASVQLNERRKIEFFLRSFVPTFFMLDPTTFNASLEATEAPNGEDVDIDGNTGDETEVTSVTSVGGSRSRSRRNGSDLRKRLLKSEQAKSARKAKEHTASSVSSSRYASPIPPEEEPTREATPAPPMAVDSVPELPSPHVGPFFVNTTFYVFLRLLETLYSRLALFKQIGEKLSKEKGEKPSQSVVEQLGLLDRPADTHHANAEHFYELMLESCERLFDNDIEQPAFEDQMRYLFGVKQAHKIFTIHKVIGALLKQVQLVFTHPRSQDLLETLKRTRSGEQDANTSLAQARSAVGYQENLFSINWLRDASTLTFQLIGKFEEQKVMADEELYARWQAYMDAYVSKDLTEGIPQARVRRPYRRKNLGLRDDSAPVPIQKIDAVDGIQIKICTRTYRMFFVSATEDFLCIVRPDAELATAKARIASATARRQKWISKRSALGTRDVAS